jgi:hypothetical protein
MKHSNSKSRQNKAAEISYTRIGVVWSDPTKQEIHLECPPGEPRPGDLMPALLHGTGLPVREDVSELRFFGHWVWHYSDIPRDVWEAAIRRIERRMVRLLHAGIIRAGHAGGFTSEEELGL